MSIYNFCLIFQHQKKIFYLSVIFYSFFLNFTNLNCGMVFTVEWYFINVCSFLLLYLKGAYHIKRK